MFAQIFLKQLVRDPSAPEFIGLGFIFRPGRFLPAQVDGVVRLEIHRLLEQFLDLGHPIVDPLLVEIEDLVGRLQVAEQNIVIERGAVFRGERVDILLGEEKMAEIEKLEIASSEISSRLRRSAAGACNGLLPEAGRPKRPICSASDLAWSGNGGRTSAAPTQTAMKARERTAKWFHSWKKRLNKVAEFGLKARIGRPLHRM